MAINLKIEMKCTNPGKMQLIEEEIEKPKNLIRDSESVI